MALVDHLEALPGLWTMALGTARRLSTGLGGAGRSPQVGQKSAEAPTGLAGRGGLLFRRLRLIPFPRPHAGFDDVAADVQVPVSQANRVAPALILFDRTHLSCFEKQLLFDETEEMLFCGPTQIGFSRFLGG